MDKIEELLPDLQLKILRGSWNELVEDRDNYDDSITNMQAELADLRARRINLQEQLVTHMGGFGTGGPTRRMIERELNMVINEINEILPTLTEHRNKRSEVHDNLLKLKILRRHLGTG